MNFKSVFCILCTTCAVSYFHNTHVSPVMFTVKKKKVHLLMFKLIYLACSAVKVHCNQV